jgi:predicted acyl esterase
MLRWYDQWLKGMDTRVMEGPPIQLYIHGDDSWRSEHEWPLARTQWRNLYLGGPSSGHEGILTEAAGTGQERRYDFDPSAPEALRGEPRLIYRTEPLRQELELTGPLALYLQAASTAPDVDWLVFMADESPDGKIRELCKGWLRASHRRTDPIRSTPPKPYHPHLASEPIDPRVVYDYPIEIWPICNVFKPGHRIRLEIANADSMIATHGRRHVTLPIKSTITVQEGGKNPSRLLVPVIPR